MDDPVVANVLGTLGAVGEIVISDIWRLTHSFRCAGPFKFVTSAARGIHG